MSGRQTVASLYRQSLALLTDLYQLTMAYGYWKLGRTDEQAAFNLFFRKHPFAGGYTVAAGLDYVLGFLDGFRVDDSDLDYLASLRGNDQRPLFEPAFLDDLRTLRFTVHIDAMPEGTVVFPHEPLLRATGPILQCQLLETPLLNMVNFQTLIATKAARVCEAAGDAPVLEFGLRRAQGIDGGLAASRAAYVGGCAATSNVLAGKLFGIPVKGTHAHSWVMSFDDERAAFAGWADVMPNNGVFLVDTYDTLAGVGRAIEVARRLRDEGHEIVGIRLDSGDLAYLSIEARKLLDDAGFADAAIVASSDLDEHLIHDLRTQGATIDIWGVGTRLATAHDDPALGGVYKLAAVRQPGGQWQPRIKRSEQAIKTTTPGILQVRRYRDDEGFVADAIYDEGLGIPDAPTVIDPADPTRRKAVPPDTPSEDLLVPIFRDGRRVYDAPSLGAIRRRTRQQLDALHPTIRRLTNPHRYPAGLEAGLHDLRMKMLLETRATGRQ